MCNDSRVCVLQFEGRLSSDSNTACIYQQDPIAVLMGSCWITTIRASEEFLYFATERLNDLMVTDKQFEDLQAKFEELHRQFAKLSRDMAEIQMKLGTRNVGYQDTSIQDETTKVRS